MYRPTGTGRCSRRTDGTVRALAPEVANGQYTVTRVSPTAMLRGSAPSRDISMSKGSTATYANPLTSGGRSEVMALPASLTRAAPASVPARVRAARQRLRLRRGGADCQASRIGGRRLRKRRAALPCRGCMTKAAYVISATVDERGIPVSVPNDKPPVALVAMLARPRHFCQRAANKCERRRKRRRC